MKPVVPTARLASFYFAYYSALGAFSPYWSLFLKQRGMDAAAIGVLMSLWYGTRVIAPGSWTMLTARSIRPVVWLRIGCFATLASFAAFLLPLDFAGLFMAMTVFCYLYNAVMPQFEAITLSHLTDRVERYGRIRVWGSVGFIFMVGAYGLALDRWTSAILPLLMLPLFALLFAASWMNDYSPGHDADGGSDSRAELRARLRRPEMIGFFLMAFFMQMSFGPFYTFFSVYLDEHGYRAATLGALWATGVAVEIVLFFVAAKLFARFSARSVLLVSLFSAIVRWLVTALFPDNLVLITLAQLSHALSFGAYFAACMLWMAKHFPGRLGGHGQGIFYGFSSGGGGAMGALIAGQVWRFGGETAFLLAAGFASVAMAIGWFTLRSEPT